jgi:hypothetical protein
LYLPLSFLKYDECQKITLFPAFPYPSTQVPGYARAPHFRYLFTSISLQEIRFL